MMRALFLFAVHCFFSIHVFSQTVNDNIPSSDFGFGLGMVFPKYVTNNVKSAKGIQGSSIAIDFNHYINTRTKPLYLSIGMRTMYYQFGTEEIQVIQNINNTLVDMPYKTNYKILCVGIPVRLNFIQPMNNRLSVQAGAGFYGCIQTRPDREDQTPFKGYAECFAGIKYAKISTSVSINKPLRAFPNGSFIAGYNLLNCSLNFRYCIK